MLFNSQNFAIFLPIVFVIYWLITTKKLVFQNALLLIASYFFYTCWNWHFLLLLMFSTLLDFITGLKIFEARNERQKKVWLWLSICINVGLLVVFKYYNFFATSFAESLSYIGLQVNPFTLKIILPIGISFYTFHGLSYVIDVYKERIKPEKKIVDYAVFVSFFPLLVAGPIERATHLLPQIKQKRTFNYTQSIDGLKQLLWGFFKKIVIADSCAQYANIIFENSGDYNGSTLVIGAVFFAFQIYGDFSGYSDIALGTARLFGIELLQNFSFPYFSRDIAEFWRRWHISLSSWFKNYLYIPLGGSKGSTFEKLKNTLIIFLVSGFWHGANWTFIIWGTLHAIYFLPLLITKTNRKYISVVAKGSALPSLKELTQMLATFGLTTFAWIFFRAQSVTQALQYISEIFSVSLFKKANFEGIEKTPITILLLILFIVIEWQGREQRYAIENLGIHQKKVVRWCMYYAILFMILFLGNEAQDFIYFQF